MATGQQDRNEVVLVGRVSGVEAARELPSGDTVLTFRVVVGRTGARTTGHDTVDCSTWRPALRRTAERLAVGDRVEVGGALRRRFWRSGAGPVSRTEVEVTRLRRVGRATMTG